ncbi:CBS domain-containing protein [Deltaproteobacteria bacterium TL4]
MHHFITLTVETAMTREIETVSLDTTVKELELLFEKRGYSMFPVVENSKLVGIVSEFDFLRNFIFTNDSLVPPYETLLEKTVADLYTSKPIIVGPDQPLTRILSLIVETKLKSFPVVVNQDQLVGVISRHDVICQLKPEKEKQR